MAKMLTTELLDQSLVGVKAYVDSKDTELSGQISAVDSKVDTVDGKVDAEAARAKAAEKQLSDDVFGEGGYTGSASLKEDLEKAIDDATGDVEDRLEKLEKGVFGDDYDPDDPSQADGGIKKELEDKIDAKQAADAGLTSLAGLTGTGVVKLTGVDTFAATTVDDTDVTAGSALNAAVTAFTAKDGSVATNKLTSGTKTYVDKADAELTIGNATDKIVLTAVADTSNGNAAGVYITGVGDNEGDELRVATVEETEAMIEAAMTGTATYKGTYTFYSESTTLDLAKGDITSKTSTSVKDKDNAIAFETTTHTLSVGTYATEGGWTWGQDTTWTNSDWAWVEDILTKAPLHTTDYPSGRIIYLDKSNTFDIIEDRVGKPDNNGITYDANGAFSLKMKASESDKFGGASVHNTLNAGNLAYDETQTITQKITSMEYTVATKSDIEEILTKVFGELPSADGDSSQSSDGDDQNGG